MTVKKYPGDNARLDAVAFHVTIREELIVTIAGYFKVAFVVAKGLRLPTAVETLTDELRESLSLAAVAFQDVTREQGMEITAGYFSAWFNMIVGRCCSLLVVGSARRLWTDSRLVDVPATLF